VQSVFSQQLRLLSTVVEILFNSRTEVRRLDSRHPHIGGENCIRMQDIPEGTPIQ
jgi:hypothetical protein